MLGLLGLLSGIILARLDRTMAFFAGRADWPGAILEARSIILDRAVKPVDEAALSAAAIDGMLRSLDDPYADFIAPDQREAFDAELTGEYAGIGATVSVADGVLTIVSPMEDSPALRAGLRPGDRVIQVDGQPTAGLRVDEASRLLRGPRGTRLLLGVRAAGLPDDAPLRTVELTRASITARSVRGVRYNDAADAWDHLLDRPRGIALVRLSQFQPGSTDEVAAAVALARRQAGGRLNALVLDLRDNPGGLLDEALALADLFLDRGVIVRLRGRAGDSSVYQAGPGEPLEALPLVVLVNAGSASASEVVAGALSEAGRALIVGSRTFGKGVVQRIEDLATLPRGQIRLTEEVYTLGSGRTIHRDDDAAQWGVDPSPGAYVALSDEQALAVSRAWFERSLIGGPAPTAPTAPTAPGQPPAPGGPEADRFDDPAWISAVLGDAALALALRAAAHRVDQGRFPDLGPGDSVTQARRLRADERARLEALADRLAFELDRLERRLDALSDDAGPGPAPDEPARP